MTKIVLIGKSSVNGNFKNLINKVTPENIPTDIVSNVYIVLHGGEKFSVGKGVFKKDKITYPDLKKHIESLNFGDNIKRIEIVVDLDVVQNEAAKMSNQLLDAYFKR